MIGAAIGAVAGMATSAMQNKAQKDMQERQAELNEQMAVRNQDRNKEMWDYTNYENQRKHMEKAGLNPALMYGQGGGGGSSTSGAQGQGVGMAQAANTGQNVAMGIQAGLQMELQKAQIDAVKADTKLKDAQAEKTAGVDTEAAKTGIENVLAQTQNEYQKQHLIRADTELKETETKLKEETTKFTIEKTEETRTNINKLVYETGRISREIDGLEIDNEVKLKTKENRIKESSLILENLGAEIFLKGTAGKVNQEQAKALVENVKQNWANYGLNYKRTEQGWQNIEQEANKIYNDIIINNKNIDLKDSQLTKDWIIGIGKLILESKK